MAENNLIVAAQNAVIQLGNIGKVLAAIFPTISGTSSTATAGAASLPAAPAGFIVTTLPDGTSVKVPYYNS